ncbi:hypothetical protein BBK36DRAFT_20145 [Trichoderma citrinoviride]|uniref:Phospholipase D-like domain-containing protein n=1 Tax=Trichoderma citrinoviride TaxID=58853 RepID=A0A2T4BB12_9HYPO|nr:hypothetical protein BBK36DRAFT_20145 [Trichoderma citrinoviride]PTB66478.1 hypothetical protein BBK36DRAFT_20145 [Trichoderma citrinoviride]
MVSDHVLRLCQSPNTVSSLLAKNPSQSPGQIAKDLYGIYEKDLHRRPPSPPSSSASASASASASSRSSSDQNTTTNNNNNNNNNNDTANNGRPSPATTTTTTTRQTRDLDLAYKCGRWGPTTPSPLFLQAFADALRCLDADPLAGVVSPPLMGTHGTVPLTVIAPLVDVIRHVSNVIARAEKEVFFITCTWSPSVAQRLNEAWLSLIRNAARHVFIQTPDLNAAPLLPALADALRRGVEVTYYVCFGYNDAGEVIPGQGGTNEQAARSLLSLLPEDGPERKLLHIYDYVAKDQDRPIHQCFKARCCHVKLLIADGQVGVQGSGNQDTQSWFHSQEINVMVDSADICAKWREGIERNQNTKLFGRVAGDGVWRDEGGKPGDGYMGDPGSVEGLIKGVWGMYKKMERAGVVGYNRMAEYTRQVLLHDQA